MPTPQLRRGRDALTKGAWEEARRAFQAALRDRRRPEALEGLGTACFWLNDAACVFDTHEEAYRLYHEQGDCASAARIALWLYWEYRAFRGDIAVSTGWLHRAERLLEGLETTREYAWLRYRQAEAALFADHDPDAARAHLTVCRAVGRQLHDVDLDVGGLALEGLTFVTSGDPVAARRCLDEAMTAIIGGELSDLTIIGQTGCHLIAACERMHDYERAAQWCDRLKEFCTRWRIQPLFAVCRTLYAGLCLSRGTWNDAETELQTATTELSSTHRPALREPIARLGELRRRQGRLEEAAALFADAPSHPISVLGNAALALERNRPLDARELVDRYLRRVPEQDRTGRIPGLELLVRAAVAQGDREVALQACGELDTIASRLSTDPVRAMAASARGRVALGDRTWDAARIAFEDASDLFTQAGMPFEAGRARIDRAQALDQASRRMDAISDIRTAIDTFESIGAAGEAAKARSWLDELESPARSAGTPFDRLTSRERDVLKLVGEGLSNADIAKRLGLSEHTVHRHVSNILTKLDLPSRTAAAAAAARSGAI